MKGIKPATPMPPLVREFVYDVFLVGWSMRNDAYYEIRDQVKTWFYDHKANMPWWQRRFIKGAISYDVDSYETFRRIVEAIGSQTKHYEEAQRRAEQRELRRARKSASSTARSQQCAQKTKERERLGT